jgi:hypothetical protein
MIDTLTTGSCERDVFASILKLLSDGANWSIYKMRLDLAIKSLRLEGHFMGKLPCPTIPELTAEKLNLAKVNKAIEAESLWQACEAHACHALASTLPDITLRKVYGKESIADMWKTVCAEYQDKTTLMQSDMRAAIQSMHCKENGNLRAHLDLMCEKKDDLAQAGVDFSSEEFTSWIIGSLPHHYSTYISNLTSTVKLLEQSLKSQSTSLYPATKPFLTSDDIIHFLKQEYDVRSQEQTPTAKTKDAALAAASDHPGPSDQGISNCKGGKPPKSPGKGNVDQSKPAGGEKSEWRVCWRCGGTGHHRDQCPSPPTEEEAKKSSGGYKGTLKLLDSANTVAEGDDSFDAFIAMETLSDSEEEANEAGDIDDEGWFGLVTTTHLSAVKALQQQQQTHQPQLPQSKSMTRVQHAIYPCIAIILNPCTILLSAHSTSRMVAPSRLLVWET